MTRESLETWLDNHVELMKEYHGDHTWFDENGNAVLTDIVSELSTSMHFREDDFKEIVEVLQPTVTYEPDLYGIHCVRASFDYKGVEIMTLIQEA